MKRGLLLLLFFTVGLIVFAQKNNSEWRSIAGRMATESGDRSMRVSQLQSSGDGIVVRLEVPGFYMEKVSTLRGEANKIRVPHTGNTTTAGEPDLPILGVPVIVDDRSEMAVRVVSAEYMDYEDVEVAPSKGEFPRTIDPSIMPYTYGDSYSCDAFFPSRNVELRKPYILRDYRGQNIVFHPFQYNPVSKRLRVYYDITVEVYATGIEGENVLNRSVGERRKSSSDFEEIYRRRFLNYEHEKMEGAKYTPLEEGGDLLIICHDAFMNAMDEFVAWKRTRGVNTIMVGTSTTGTTYSAIKSYIASQYAANSNLTYVLLVGDVEQIPGYPYEVGSVMFNGKGDNPYVQIVGDDFYNDLIIGRFSAQTEAQVTTQVQRTINYERNLDNTDSWCQMGMGITAINTNSGADHELDWEHLENIRTDLINYGYSTVYQEYYGVNGFNSTTSQIENEINGGVGIINYCGHGDAVSWRSHTPIYSISKINSQTNDNMLPIVFSVGCQNGFYQNSDADCFAEAWMHATNGRTGAPTGAIGAVMSYIYQPWTPPMYAQDEFVDIIVESYSDNIKHTLGGTVVNALLGIFERCEQDDISAIGTYQSWILFGDPTLMIRTKTPQPVSLAYSPNFVLEAPTFVVAAQNAEGATVTLSTLNHNILGTAKFMGGVATINVSEPLDEGTELILCFSGYNKVTQVDTITVVSGTTYSITYNGAEHGTISGPEEAYSNSIVTLTAMPDSGYHISEWQIEDAMGNSVEIVDGNGTTLPGNHFIMPESDVEVGAIFERNGRVILAEVENGTISATPMDAAPGVRIELSAVGDEGYALGEWGVRRCDNSQEIEVTENGFEMQEVDVVVSATFVLAHRIGIATVNNGTIYANREYAMAGDSVTLSALANQDYEFFKWYVYNTEDINNEVTVTDNRFIMPDNDVTVAAIFRYAVTHDDTVTGTTRHSTDMPLSSAYAYSLSQQIYTPDEVGEAGIITAISFRSHYATIDSDTRNIDIYISNTSKTEFSGNSDWVRQHSSDIYFSGNFTIVCPAWNTIVLDRPFVYDGSSNLLITVDDNTGSYASLTDFIMYGTGAKRSIFITDDDVNYTPSGSPGEGFRDGLNNQIIFHKNIDNQCHLSLSVDSLVGFGYRMGDGPSETQSVGVLAYNIFNPMEIVAPESFEVSDAADGVYTPSLQFEPLDGIVRQMLYFRMKGNLAIGSYREQATFEADNLNAEMLLDGQVWEELGIGTVAEEPFVVCNGDGFVVNGTGELQVIDVMGRVIFDYTIHDAHFTIHKSHFPSPGVYIFRLIGDGVKAQKIVVGSVFR